MTALLGIGVEAGGAQASAGVGGALAAGHGPQGATSTGPVSGAGDEGFRSSFQGMFGKSGVEGDPVRSARASAAACARDALPRDRPEVDTLPQVGAIPTMAEAGGTKQSFEAVLNPALKGGTEVLQRNIGKAAVSTTVAHGSAKQGKVEKRGSFRKSGDESASQAGSAGPLVSAPVPVNSPAAVAKTKTAADWKFHRTRPADTQNSVVVSGGPPGHPARPAGASGKIDGVPNMPVAEAGGSSAAAQPDLASDRWAANRGLGKLNLPQGEELPGRSAVAEPKNDPQARQSEKTTIPAENDSASAIMQSDPRLQTGLSADTVLHRRAEVQSGSRVARDVSSGEAGVPGVHSGVAVPAAVIEMATLPHHPIAGQSGENALHPTPSGSAGTGAAGAAIASRETFAALDGEGMADGPAWMHAGAQRAEAGFQDPALGWVAVRADAGAGGVHASIVPGSTDAAQALGGHLAGLHAHLAAEQIPVLSLSVNASAEIGEAGFGQGNLQQNSRHSGQGGQQGPGFQSNIHESAAGFRFEKHSAASRAEEIPAMIPGQGIYISVLA